MLPNPGGHPTCSATPPMSPQVMCTSKPQRCAPQSHSHLAGSNCICYEGSILSPWPGLQSSLEIIPKPRSHHQSCHRTYSVLSTCQDPVSLKEEMAHAIINRFFKRNSRFSSALVLHTFICVTPLPLPT